MSNVKEAYESAFGPEGMKSTNLVLKTLSPVPIRKSNATPWAPNGAKAVIVGNRPLFARVEVDGLVSQFYFVNYSDK